MVGGTGLDAPLRHFFFDAAHAVVEAGALNVGFPEGVAGGRWQRILLVWFERVLLACLVAMLKFWSMRLLLVLPVLLVVLVPAEAGLAIGPAIPTPVIFDIDVVARP